MSEDKPAHELDRYIVRFPDGMRERLKEIAKVNGRSLNAEIIARLEATLRVTEKDISVQDVLPSLFSIYEGLEEGIEAILDRLDRLESQVTGASPKPRHRKPKPSDSEG